MLFEIGFEKNGVCQARVIDGPSAEICTAYFAEIEHRATIYGAGPADGVKPGQPCTTVPADWTPASMAAPAAPAAEPAADPVPLAPADARPQQRLWRIMDTTGHRHDFSTATAAAAYATRTGTNGTTVHRRASNARGVWIRATWTGLQAAADAEKADAAIAAATKNVTAVAAPVPDPDTPVPAHFSDGNMKLGKIANFSLAPMTTCSRQACETCGKDGCYALKSYHAYPSTRAAWDDNTALALYSPECLETIIRVYLSKKRRRPIHFFRLHVGGDFVTADYLRMWCRVAADFPQIHFLAFTKRFDIVRECLDSIPANLTIRLSDWPGTVVPADLRQHFHVAWMDDGTRPADTFPADALECPGNCETCGACWDLDRDTIFEKH